MLTTIIQSLGGGGGVVGRFFLGRVNYLLTHSGDISTLVVFTPLVQFYKNLFPPPLGFLQ